MWNSGVIIIVVAISKPNTTNILERLLSFLSAVDIERIQEGIFLINDTKFLKRFSKN